MKTLDGEAPRDLATPAGLPRPHLLPDAPAARSIAQAMRRAGPGHDLPRGAPVLRRLRSDRVQRYYLFVPPSFAPGRELVVLVHGISRNAREQVVSFAPLAARSGHALVAPVFTREFCRDYQRLGSTGGGRRADLLLQEIVAEATRDLGAAGGPFALFGHSGGAQFAHRYALAWPSQVRSLAACAAGNYSFPDASLPFPLGIGRAGAAHAPALDLEAFLRIPTLVAVGSRDTGRDANLRRDQGLDALQGRHRVERARRWVAALREAAAARGIAPGAELVTIPGAGHRFADTVRRGLCDAVWPRLASRPDSPARD